jgi:hypothetical protein
VAPGSSPECRRSGWPGGPAVAAAEEHREIGQHRDRTGHRGADRGNEDVAVLHMRQLVRHHAAQLALAEHLDDAGGGRNGGVLRVAPGGKSVWGVLVYQIDARHRQAGRVRQLLAPCCR